jgi:phosphopantetheinyl transferase
VSAISVNTAIAALHDVFGVQQGCVDAAAVSSFTHLLPATCGLHPVEQHLAQRYSSMRRRDEFVAGRLLLRSCIIDVLRKAGTEPPPASEIAIGRAESRQPVVLIGDALDERLCVSISHGGGFVLCAAALEIRIGVDVERIDDRVARLRERYASDDEYRLIHSRAYDRHEETALLTRLWTVKESAAKCFGEGMLVAFDRCRLVAVDGERWRVRYVTDSGEVELTASSVLYEGCVFSLVVPPA